MNDLILSSKRLLLKGITPALIHELYETQSKEDIIRFFGFDEADYQKFKAMHEKGMETYHLSLFFFLLINKQTGQSIGECGFHNWHNVHNRAELFYKLRNDADKRQGLMTEALPLVLDHGFNRMHLHRIEALVAEWNTPSVKLLQRHGFTKEGTMREDYFFEGSQEDSDCYSLLKREWQKLTTPNPEG